MIKKRKYTKKQLDKPTVVRKKSSKSSDKKTKDQLIALTKKMQIEVKKAYKQGVADTLKKLAAKKSPTTKTAPKTKRKYKTKSKSQKQ